MSFGRYNGEEREKKIGRGSAEGVSPSLATIGSINIIKIVLFGLDTIFPFLWV